MKWEKKIKFLKIGFLKLVSNLEYLNIRLIRKSHEAEEPRWQRR